MDPEQTAAAPPRIHPTAQVDPGAVIGQGVEIGPFAVVEGGVTIEAGCRLIGSCWVLRGTTLGPGVTIHPSAVVGGVPQDFGWKGAESFVRIGAGTIIREAVTVHRATTAGGTTEVGARCMLMAGSHVAHDCKVGDDVIIANQSVLAGHVHIGSRAFISAFVAVHQFVRIGRLAMIGGQSGAARDVPPFFTLAPAFVDRMLGLNTLGLRRGGVAPAARTRLRAAFHTIYREGRPISDALAVLEADPTPEVQEIVAFIRASKRGIVNKLYQRAGGDVDARGEEGEAGE